jgi:hypothetical protein
LPDGTVQTALQYCRKVGDRRTAPDVYPQQTMISVLKCYSIYKITSVLMMEHAVVDDM